MRRKSERTVKSSPTKKSEPTNRRSTRRGRKSPEKSVNEDESEHSSDQASSSENEPEEVIPPKRTRRTSRTIEKSSSAEEVKATTTTRQRRARGAAKKDADIPEEENVVDAEQTTVTEEPTLNEIVEETTAEKTETIDSNVDSSTEVVNNQNSIDDSNKSAQDDNNEKEVTPIETEQNQEPEENVENATTIEVKPDVSEPVESTKTVRRRTLKRLEREISKEDSPQVIEEKPAANEQNENEVDSQEKSPKTLSNDEVKSSDDSKFGEQSEAELQNGSVVNNDIADTTAKDTTASETESRTKLNKKKPIVRKRKWLTNKTAAPKVQEIAISTDSLKGLIELSDVKPVPLSDVKLDSSPEVDRESDVIVSSTSIDYNSRSDEHLVESTEDGNAANITTSRKISIVNESEGEPLSPAKHSPCNILYITNLVRPFTVLQLKSLLQRTGKIAEDGFWIDKIKSKCFVKYETEDEAIETRHALHGIRWPTSNPKNLNVDFGTETLMEKAIASTADEVKPSVSSRDDRIASSIDLNEPGRDKITAAERPVREWDLGKKDSRVHQVERVEREREKEREQKQSRDTGRDNERERERDRDREHRGDRDRDRDRGDRKRRSTSVSPSRRYTKKDNEPPLRLLDDLFRKTKTTPCIYWLPLTPEQIAVRIEERKKAIERREAMRKEREQREREEAEERERRREKRREESRERQKRRDESREKDREKRREESQKRREGSRDGEKRRDDSQKRRDDSQKRRGDSQKRRDDSHDRRGGHRDDRDTRRRY